MEDIFVTALYCDDIRQEMGGKLSFMGVYNSALVVPQFPATVPKLCVQVTVRIPLETKANNLTVRVLLNEQQVAEVAVPEGELSKALSSELNLDSPLENRQITVALAVQFAPLQLEQHGLMRVRAIVDGRELKANALVIRLPTEAEQGMSLAV
jgi:hypothetical protein